MSNQRRIHLAFALFWGCIIYTIIYFITIFLYGNIIIEHAPSWLFMTFVISYPFILILLLGQAARLNPRFMLRLPRSHNKVIYPKRECAFIKGAPNNRYSDFNLDALSLLSFNEIEFELKDGVFYTFRNNRNVKIDMKGWIRKKFYVYCLLMTYLKATYVNSFPDDYELKLIIKYKNKEKVYYLIKDGYLSEKLSFRREYFCRKYVLKKMRVPLEFKSFYNFASGKYK